MATSSVNWSGRELQKTQDGWESVLTWTVIDAADEDAALAATPIDGSDPPIPSKGDAHPTRANQKCRTVGARAGGGPTTWLVTANYTTKAVGNDGGGDPLLEPSVYGATPGTISKELTQDIYGNPITNSTWQPPQTPRQHDVLFWHLLTERNEPYFDVNGYSSLAFKLNSTALNFNGLVIPPRRAVYMPPQLMGMYQSTATHVRVGHTLIYRLDGEYAFDEIIPDVGNKGFYASGKEGNFVYENNSYPIEAVRLQGNGTPIDSTIKILDNTGAKQTPVTSGFTTNVASRPTLIGSASTMYQLVYRVKGEEDLNILAL